MKNSQEQENDVKLTMTRSKKTTSRNGNAGRLSLLDKAMPDNPFTKKTTVSYIKKAFLVHIKHMNLAFFICFWKLSYFGAFCPFITSINNFWYDRKWPFCKFDHFNPINTILLGFYWIENLFLIIFGYSIYFGRFFVQILWG